MEFVHLTATTIVSPAAYVSPVGELVIETPLIGTRARLTLVLLAPPHAAPAQARISKLYRRELARLPVTPPTVAEVVLLSLLATSVH